MRPGRARRGPGTVHRRETLRCVRREAPRTARWPGRDSQSARSAPRAPMPEAALRTRFSCRSGCATRGPRGPLHCDACTASVGSGVRVIQCPPAGAIGSGRSPGADAPLSVLVMAPAITGGARPRPAALTTKSGVPPRSRARDQVAPWTVSSMISPSGRRAWLRATRTGRQKYRNDQLRRRRRAGSHTRSRARGHDQRNQTSALMAHTLLPNRGTCCGALPRRKSRHRQRAVTSTLSSRRGHRPHEAAVAHPHTPARSDIRMAQRPDDAAVRRRAPPARGGRCRRRYRARAQLSARGSAAQRPQRAATRARCERNNEVTPWRC